MFVIGDTLLKFIYKATLQRDKHRVTVRLQIKLPPYDFNDLQHTARGSIKIIKLLINNKYNNNNYNNNNNNNNDNISS